MTNHYNETSYYRNTNPLIQYGDSWIYGAALPSAGVAIPTNVYVLHEKNYNIISWTNPAENDMKAYMIQRSKTYGHADATTIAIVDTKDLNGKVQTCYIDYLTENEETTQYYYSVIAVDNTNYRSLNSDWNADINLTQSFTSYKYLYTDQMTQTYWNTLDLLKKLGNFDTDRNVIPYRDLGNDYKQVKNPLGTFDNVAVKKDCNYLYATLLTLNDDQKAEYANGTLTYKLYMDETLMASNVPQTVLSANIAETSEPKSVNGIVLNKELFSKAVDLDLGEESSKEFIYNSSIEVRNDPNGNITNLKIDRLKFLNKYFESNNYTEGDITYNIFPNNPIVFYYDGPIYKKWHYGGPSGDVVTLSDWGIKYELRYATLPNTSTVILVSEYWKNVTDDVNLSAELNTSTNVVILYTTVIPKESYGISYLFDLIDNKTTLVVDYSKQAYIYFRVPYIYDSKLLQTYIIDNVSGKKVNNINFKTYNYLIFPSVLGKIFNQKQIELKEARGNLYKTDAASSAIYQNFGSFFDFEQPAWLDEKSYRRCVLGDDSNPGLLDAGMNGGTFKGIKQAISAISSGNATLSDQSATKYLTTYLDYTEVTNLPTINLYNASNTYNVGDIIAYNEDLATQGGGSSTPESTNILEINSVIPSDACITLYGNGVQTGNSIEIIEGATCLNGTTDSTEFLIEGCEYTDVSVAPDVPYTYLKCVNSPISGVTVELGTQSFINVDNDYKDGYFGIVNSDNTAVSIYKVVRDKTPLVGTVATKNTHEDWIFKEEYNPQASTDPLSYTHNYIINTWNVDCTNWVKAIVNERYVVYGNTIKLNNTDLVESEQVTVVNASTNVPYVPSTDYTVDRENGYINWTNSNTKPEDGTYVNISYSVDIRKEIIRIINLIKYPQININYIWDTEA